MNEKGHISVHTENIFPIIKKFLYSDHEVFLRELVSNAVDATQKLKQLAAMGQYEGDVAQLKVKVSINESRKTITVSDQGLGMTADEIKQYINQVAFSGATEFVEKYKDHDSPQQLIGFFGLGFYSAFMVADKVEIITKSYQKDTAPAHWTCDGTTQFEISKTIKKEVGTDIILHLSPDSEEFLQPSRLQQILHKYCQFLPVEIEFDGNVINDSTPIWVKPPSELKDEDYLAFYKKLYPAAPAPLFWIHLNVDYPFHLTGILYFPQVSPGLEQQRHHIQLYAKQVFITDEVKHIVPEFLMLLHGVIDSPDIPLNVSRSALQTDSNVRKINTYITKKVADKLEELFQEDRKAYEEKWSSMALFVQYGMLTEDKFYEKAQAFALLKNTAGTYFTIEEYQEKVKPLQTDKQENLVVLYATAPAQQDRYIQSCTQQGYDVLVMEQPVDQHFVSLLERKLDKVVFKGVDTDTISRLIDKGEALSTALTEEEQKKLQTLYEEAVQAPQVTWSVAALPADELPVTITVPEFLKRMHNLGSNLTTASQQPLPLQAIINANHSLVQKLLQREDADQVKALATQAYRLALLSQNLLRDTALTDFIQQSVETLAHA
ncbi:MAG: molecular chaperone HtpG [Bacteroidota bacterium]